MASSEKGKSRLPKRDFAAPVSDPRFARLHTDPRFLRPNKRDGQVVVDARFQGLIDQVGGRDKGKSKGPKLDQYGRPLKHDDRKKREMERLYRREEQEGSEDDEDDEDEEESDDEEADARPIDYARGEGQLESSSDESDSEEEDSDEDSEDEEVVLGSATARRRELHRKEYDDDESDSDIDSEDVIVEQEGNESKLAKLDAEAERTVKEEARRAKQAAKASKAPAYTGDTHRLAVVNMDWDHIRGIDLFKVFSSVVSPAGAAGMGPTSRRHDERQIVPIRGRCLSVRVYPSEFGRQRMAKEIADGPPREIFAKPEDVEEGSHSKSKKKKKGRGKGSKADEGSDSDEDLFEIDEGGEFDEEALRKYQVDRLRYFYAIATFDRPETARFIMDQIDGTEMEHSANMFDLSFVPTDMTFPDWQAPKDEPGNEGFRDEATETTDETAYSGVDFTTDVLRHSKVKLTWDADDPQRTKVTRSAKQTALNANQLRDDDFKAYLASASEDSDLDEEDEGEDGQDASNAAGRERMRALLGLTGAADTNGFGKAKSAAFADARKQKTLDKQGEMQITFLPGLSEAAERKRRGEKATEEETTLDAYRRKQREKRERKKGTTKIAADEEEADPAEKANFTFDDPFFADDGEVDFDAALAAESNGTRNAQREKKGKKEQARAAAVQSDGDDDDDESNRRTLQLMTDGDDDDSRHFNLKDIVKAEQQADGKGKKNRWAKKKEKKLAKQGDALPSKGNDETQPTFQMDVKDPRFAALYEDHRFAIDPNHPSFVKTKAMQEVMEERRRREQKRQKQAEQDARRASGDASSSVSNERPSDDLSRLVQSVKKRAANGDGGSLQKQKKNKQKV